MRRQKTAKNGRRIDAEDKRSKISVSTSIIAFSNDYYLQYLGILKNFQAASVKSLLIKSELWQPFLEPCQQ